jgi:hypothetical protein
LTCAVQVSSVPTSANEPVNERAWPRAPVASPASETDGPTLLTVTDAVAGALMPPSSSSAVTLTVYASLPVAVGLSSR